MEPGVYAGTYVGKEMFGFKQNHTYQFKLTHNGINYELTAFSDDTEDEETNLYVVYSSEKSIKTYWDIEE